MVLTMVGTATGGHDAVWAGQGTTSLHWRKENMRQDIVIDQRVRLAMGTFGVEGRVTCVERHEDDSVFSVLIRTLSVGDMGSIYFTAAEIDANGWTLDLLDVTIPTEREQVTLAQMN